MTVELTDAPATEPDHAMGMRLDKCDIVVIGAGIGGTAAALALTLAGASVTLLEQVAEPRAVGAGILLQPNGLAVLDGLGVGTQVRAAGHPLATATVRSPTGSRLAELSPPDYGPGLDHLLAVRRSRLQEILFDAVDARPGISLRLGAQVTAARPDGAVDLQWHGRPSTIDADLVVAADGASSMVRATGAFAARTTGTGQRYLRGLVPAGDLGLAGEYWTAMGLFGGAPVDAGTTYVYADATAPPVAAALATGDADALRRVWAAALPAAPGLAESLPPPHELLLNDIVIVHCERWVDGRLVLLGDAAHAMAPTVGQGANSALVDAAVLVAAIAQAPSLAAGLAAYVARRRPAVTRVQRRASTLARLAGVRGSTPRALRDRVLATVARIPGAATTAVHRLQQEDPAALRRLLRSVNHQL
jgi:2-polyprenyl-6-methoxyphenol hydroxylase-like FAD-dependent oxidoreductase